MTALSPDPMNAVPPLREQPNQPDGRDQDRVKLVRDRWDGQSGALLPYHRQIEEQVRMIAGRHWEVWSEPMRRYVDVTQYMSEQERFWLQRPVFNLLVYWFQITHARLTESPPSPIFQPATSDRLDRELADCLTPVFRTLWAETQMEEAFVRATAWLCIAGSVYIESSADFSHTKHRSPPPVADDAGMVDPSVYDGGTAYGDEYDAQPMGEQAGEESEGCLVPRVRNPLEVRAEWGADIPWERKRWIITRSYLTLDEARSLYGVDVTPTADADGSSSILQRLLFSSGYYDSASLASTLFGADNGGGRQVAIDTMWEAPSELSPETDESPGGRLLIVAGDQVLHDSARPYRTKCAGPIRRANFLELAGRGGFGSTPLESMIAPQKAYNRGWAQILQHRNLCTNPILFYDNNSGVDGDISNLPGSMVPFDAQANGSQPPAFYLQPPTLSADVWRTQQSLLDLIRMLGSTAGAEGAPQTDDPSGNLVEQLRFNSDRPVAVAARSLASMIAGMVEDWVAILPAIWPAEKTLQYAGEDEMFRNVTLTPDLWEGAVNVRPDLENARLETPESKEQRAMAKYAAGLFGDPKSPEAAAKFAEYARTAKLEGLVEPPSSVDSDMIRHVMSMMVQGEPFNPTMLKEWYDYGTWTRVLREHLASPEFLKHDPATQQQFEMLWAYVQTAQVAQQQTVMQRQAPLMAEQAATQGAIAKIAQAHGPQEPVDPSQPPKSGDRPSPDAIAA